MSPDSDPTEPLSKSNGTVEIGQVTRIIEEAGICCLVSGTSVLIYYGAGRVRGDWEICVPEDRLDDVVSLIQHSSAYLAVLPTAPQPSSLLHTFPRFKRNGIRLFFVLVPSTDCCLPCEPSNIDRSLGNLPYPKLDTYIQSLFETHNQVDLCDAVDGSNVSEEWGYKHLNLDGPVNLKWLHLKNKAIANDVAQRGSKAAPYLFQIAPILDRRSKWITVVREKQRRLGLACPTDLFETRFRLHGSQDPWLKGRV